MANIKISQLPSATSVSAGDVLPIVQNGQTKKVDVSLIGTGGGGGGGSIIIPQPQFKIKGFTANGNNDGFTPMDVYYQNQGSDEWLNHSPELWVFRYIKTNRKKKKLNINDNVNFYYVGKHWSHPGHVDGNNPYIIDDAGHKIYNDPLSGLTSQWVVPSDWKSHSMLPNFTFNTKVYWRGIEAVTSWPVSTFDVDMNSVRPKTSNFNSKSILFKFRFIIRDPNNIHKIIMGPDSDQLMCYRCKPNSTLFAGFGLSIRKK